MCIAAQVPTRGAHANTPFPIRAESFASDVAGHFSNRRPDMARKPRIITESVKFMRDQADKLEATTSLSHADLGDIAADWRKQADKLDKYHGGSANLDPSEKAKPKKRK
jgi:hypothetical protein